jgi:hypothetical protein
MSVLVCIALFAAGHMVRDGWPGFKPMLSGLIGTRWEWVYHLSTQWARISGAAICGLGAWSWLVFAGILAGYYFDMKHGEGQGPDDTWGDTWTNLPFLALSGITSLIPLTMLSVVFLGANHWPLVFVGLAKVVIWPLAWNLVNPRWGWFWEPTRIAAMSFGAAIGAAVALGV